MLVPTYVDISNSAGDYVGASENASNDISDYVGPIDDVSAG
jgi:hypothetical protein